MDDMIQMIDDLIDNHYRVQHLIGTEEEESEYLQDMEDKEWHIIY